MNVFFKEWPLVAQPAPETRLWRYMTLSKFQSLVQARALYFCRVDRFEDWFEGAITEPAAGQIEQLIRQAETPDLLGNAPDISYYKAQFSARMRYRKFFYANCWHCSPSESAAMWKLYLGSAEGVAIRTTFATMRQAIPVPQRGRLCGGLVSYVDYNADSFDALGPIDAYFHKRLEYQHESEYRFLYQYFPEAVYPERVRGVIDASKHIPGSSFQIHPAMLNLDVKTEPGILHEVDLHKLVEDVILSPRSSESTMKAVTESMRSAGMEARAMRSALDGEPRF